VPRLEHLMLVGRRAYCSGMDRIWTVGRVLAALEQVPGDPTDLTMLLRDPIERQALIGAEDGSDQAWSSALQPAVSGARTDLGRFLVEHADHGRVETWAKVVERGINEGRFMPMILGWSEYPGRLAQASDAPPLLFRRIGDNGQVGWSTQRPGVPTDDTSERAVAIVGARQTTPAVLAATAEVAAALGRHGIRIVSGLAAGVDTAAHKGALEVGAVTTAVMGTGVDHVFPRENGPLAEEIACRGVVLSQFAPPAPRTGTTFLRRNCVIAALSDASIVMDAGEQSGSRHELEQAIRYGKHVFMWRPTLGQAAWARALEQVGVASFVESAEEVLARLG
jgi:DNA processing protein